MERLGSSGGVEAGGNQLNPGDSVRSNLEQMGESLVVAFDWALGTENESEQVEIVEELFSYAASVGELSNQEIDTLFGEALKEGE